MTYYRNLAFVLLEMLFTRLRSALRNVFRLSPKSVESLWSLGDIREKEASKPRKILIFAYMGLGDAVMMLPMLRAVRHAFPDASVTALSTLPSPAQEILRLSGCVDAIELFAFKQKSLRERLALIRRLQKEKFDVVFCPYTTPMPYFVRLVSSIPVRVGHVSPEVSRRNPQFGYLFTNVVKVGFEDKIHETTRYLMLAEAVGIAVKGFETNIYLQPTSEQISRAEAYLQKQGMNEKTLLIGVHPAVGATMPWRQWGIENLQQAAEMLIREQEALEKQVSVLLFGSNADLPLLEKMRQHLAPKAHIIIPDAVSTSDDVPLAMTMAFLQRCSMLLANDGGIAHLATAARVPLVRIFGMADYHGYKAVTAENSAPVRDMWKALPCSPCMGLGVVKPGYNVHNCGHRNCLALISVEEVVRAAREIMPTEARMERAV